MKLAPLARALAARPAVRHVVVHTGQHYDPEMSDAFFRDLALPRPHANLDVGSGSHAQQTAAIMGAFEPVLLATRPELVLVHGDVNSTVAAALLAAKLDVRVGRRSTAWSRTLLFAPSRDAVEVWPEARGRRTLRSSR